MNELEQAIAEFRAAIEALKVQKAKAIGTAIGNAIGQATFYIHRKTEAEIDEMSLSALESWVDAVEASPPV